MKRYLALTLLVLAVFTQDSWSKTSSSGGSRSSFSSRSSSRPPSSKPSVSKPPSGGSWFGSKKATVSPPASSPKPQTVAPAKPTAPGSSFGSSGTKAAIAVGVTAASANSFTKDTSTTKPVTKTDYVNSFKQANAAKYQTKFVTEPKIRPTYVPQTYQYQGRPVAVNYDQSRGGYGFYDHLGTFLLYDALSDAADRNYVAVAQPQVQTGPMRATPSEGDGGWMVVAGLAGLCLCGIGAYLFLK